MNNRIMQGVFKRFKPELNKSYDIVIENDYFIVSLWRIVEQQAVHS